MQIPLRRGVEKILAQMKFKHYIITRLAQPKSTVDWLKSRQHLFNSFYLKGISIQTVKNFSVKLLISDEIDYNFSGFNLNKPNITIHSYELFESNPSSILSPEDFSLDAIISSRLDSDDLLANKYISNIQQHALVDSVIDHKYYFFLGTDLKKFSLESSNCNSMFLSTCCNPSNFNTHHCLSSLHRDLFKSKKFTHKKLIPEVGSAAICHGPNSNSTYFRRRKQQEVNPEQFKSLFY